MDPVANGLIVIAIVVVAFIVVPYAMRLEGRTWDAALKYGVNKVRQDNRDKWVRSLTLDVYKAKLASGRATIEECREHALHIIERLEQEYGMDFFHD